MGDTTVIEASPAPRVPGWPVIGPVADVQRDLLGVYERAQRECGDVARLVTGVPPLRHVVHLVMHPDGARHVLAGHGGDYGKDSAVYEELRAYVGNGLLTGQDGTWARQRRLVQPLFTPRRVAGYSAVMREEAQTLVRSWQADAATGRPVDLGAGSMSYALRVVGRILLGSALDDVVDVLTRTADPLQRHIVFRGLAPARLPRQWPSPGGLAAARHRRDLYAAVDAVIARARPDDAEATDLLTLLLRARDPLDGSALSLDEVRDQVLVFMLAGHETTANALTYTFHLLGRHPRVQEGILAESGDLAAAAPALVYTRQAVQEAMRLYPPVCHIGRDARRDDVVLGRRVRKGDPVVIPTWVLHRDARWWPDPLRYDPGRFDDEAAAARHRYAYLPFGGGPRSCIGWQFALLEASIAVAAVVDAFQVSTPSSLPSLFAGITLRPRGPVRARLEVRRP